MGRINPVSSSFQNESLKVTIVYLDFSTEVAKDKCDFSPI